MSLPRSLASLTRPDARARLLGTLALAAVSLSACNDSPRRPSTSQSSGTSLYAGPQALVFRVARSGGPPRVYGYPRVDSSVWQGTDLVPTPTRILAFDDEDGTVAYEDSRGVGVLLELRLGTISMETPPGLRGLSSAIGNAIFGVDRDGNVVRLTPTGVWTLDPPQDAQAVHPQSDGTILVTVGTGADTKLLRYRPPDRKVLADIPFPVATRTVRTQLGDQMFLAVDSGIVMLRTRTMDWGTIAMAEPIEMMTATPSGDRVFAIPSSRREIVVIDRFRGAITARVPLPAEARDLRIDPFGRYLLVRAADVDSAWVVAIGTDRVLGAIPSSWRVDLPFVGYDGAIVTAAGNDVLLYDGESLRELRRVRGGARDFWFPFMWDGFRPRAASLDQPVQFDSAIFDTTRPDSLLDTTGALLPLDSAAPVDTTRPRGFIVSFAAFLVEERARELATRIVVNGSSARVVATPRDGATIFRVILGPYPTREEAERAGTASGQAYWVYEGSP